MNNAIRNIPHKNAQGQIWIEWHKALKRRYGKKKANELFKMAYERRIDATISNFLELQEYMSKQGVKLEGNFWQEMQKDWDSGFSSVTGTMKLIGISVAIILLIVLGVLLYSMINISKNPQEFAKLAASIKPI